MPRTDTSSIQDIVTDFFTSYPPKKYQRDEHIALPGEPLPGVLFIEQGIVGMYDMNIQGNTIVLNTFKPGAFLPMSWAINATPNEYYYQAFTDVSARIAPAVEVVTWLKQQPVVMFDLLQRVYRGTDGILGRVSLLMGGSAEARVMFELINATLRFASNNGDAPYKLAMTERNIAANSGLTRETVNREFRKLKDKGLIAISPGHITILSLEGLKHALARATH